MVKIIAFTLIFCSLIFGADLKSDLKNILSTQNYAANEAKLNELFSDESAFLDARQNIDYAYVIDVLRQNSLLNLRLSQSADMKLIFEANSSPLLLVQIINRSLEHLGYKYFRVASLDNVAQKVAYGVFLDSKSLLNLGNFYKELLANGVYILGIFQNEEYGYTYVLDAKDAIIATKSPQESEFTKSPSAYFYSVMGASNINIQAHSNDSWFALVRIYDKNLKLIKEIKSKQKQSYLNINLPDGATYIQISDVATLENIKRGLKINIK